MITVMGATGRVGRRITELLRERGQDVRAVGRSPEGLAALAGLGAQPCAGDAADAAFLTDAFRGADAVFTMLPADPDAADVGAAQDAKGEAIATAVRAAGVPYVVMLSSLGAEQESGTGFIESLHRQEVRLRSTGVPLLALRPGWFFENYAESLQTVAELGIVADSLAPDVAVPMVAARDVAEVAAAALVARDRTGVREVLGPRDLSPVEATAILGASLGRPDLPYVQLPDDEMAGALVEAGMSADAAARHVAMTRAIAEGRIISRTGRTPATASPTPFEVVARELAGRAS